MNLQTTWQKVLAVIQQKVTPTSYRTWFLPASLHGLDEQRKIAYLEMEGNFQVNLIRNRYIPTLTESFQQALGEPYQVVVQSSEEYEEQALNQDRRDTTRSGILNMSSGLQEQRIFNPKFSFDNFVVGNSNLYAQKAAMAVANEPSRAYNPFFIYGGSGLGKTHLMHAIGLYLLEHRPELNILYVSSEMFTNEFIKALGENKTREFKNKYRKLDVLMVDDIQFLGGKESTQEEFFNTFNTLFDLNKQIIISSDRHPSELDKLTPRLRSRFSWNIVAGIAPPDYETRVAILEKKAANAHRVLDSDMKEVISLIAENVTDNIRDLEGALNTITGFSDIMNEHIDAAFARRILKDMLQNGGGSVTPEKIKTMVSRYYKVSVEDLESSTRKKTIADPRQVAMYLCRTMTDYSFEKIGNLFGNRHYSTVMHACDKIQEQINAGAPVKDEIEDLKQKINS